MPTLDLNDITKLTSLLRGGGFSKKTPKGFFTRSMDFNSSYNKLARQFRAEYEAASKLLPQSISTDELHQKLNETDLRIHMTSNESFDTYDLSPALRHFINDTCRLLEPLVSVLADCWQLDPRNGKDKAGKDKFLSLNALIIKAKKDKNITGLIDDNFFLALYEELWNEYKHMQSMGIGATTWKYENGTIVKPYITGDRISSYKDSYFKKVAIDDFMKLTLENISNLAGVIAR